MSDPAFNRRQALAGASTISLGALLAACGGDGATSSTSAGPTETTAPGGGARGRSGEPTSLFDDSSACALTPEMTEGPYYFDADKVRSDIREDRDGVRLRLAIRVRDARCEPLPNAVVEIWHCDAGGIYSGFEAASQAQGGAPGGPPGGDSGPSDDETYLRGAQVTDRDGIVEFITIYPGWYQGRTTHIHAMVHLDAASALTTQFYFDEEVNSAVYPNRPYKPDSDRQVLNDGDGLFDSATLLDLRAEEDGYLGTISVDVAPA